MCVCVMCILYTHSCSFYTFVSVFFFFAILFIFLLLFCWRAFFISVFLLLFSFCFTTPTACACYVYIPDKVHDTECLSALFSGALTKNDLLTKVCRYGCCFYLCLKLVHESCLICFAAHFLFPFAFCFRLLGQFRLSNGKRPNRKRCSHRHECLQSVRKKIAHVQHCTWTF